MHVCGVWEVEYGVWSGRLSMVCGRVEQGVWSVGGGEQGVWSVGGLNMVCGRVEYGVWKG